MTPPRLLSPILILAATSPAIGADDALPESLSKSLTFAASFDGGFDAEIAAGDPTFFSSSSASREDPVAGPVGPGVDLLEGGGRSGNALRFTVENTRAHFFQVQGNLPYTPPGEASEGWSGSISYFMSLDPETDLPPRFADPIQVTDSRWNDAAIWCDFTKDDRPRVFRLGVLADLEVWNPENKDFETMPAPEKPVVVVKDTPFASGKWTHVVITFERFNTGKPDGEARLYLDGKLQGTVSGRNQQYSWDPGKAVIFLGLGYVGLMDDLMVFDRALSEEEVGQITELARDGSPLLPTDRPGR